jgi:Zn-finger nucleic acid-binding protein
MPYLTCPSCALTLAALGSGPEIDHCPRCHARRGIVVEMLARRDPSAKPRPQKITKLSAAPHAAPSADPPSPLRSPGSAPAAAPKGRHAAW